MSTVLEIAKAAAPIIGIEEPVSLYNATQPTERTMWRLMDRAGRNLVRERNAWGAGWTVLNREHVFETVADQEEYVLPNDFIELIDETAWDRTNYLEMRGPLSPQEWQAVRSSIIESVTLTPRYRLRRNAAGTGRSLWLDPVPASVEELVFEYLSRNWLRASDGTFREKIEADSDEPVFDDDLMEMDLVWRMKHSLDLAFGVELAEFEYERDRRIARDAGSRPVNLGGRTSRFLTRPVVGVQAS